MRFIADSMFGKLARTLRMLGYDTVYVRDNERSRLSDPDLLSGRTLITTDRKISGAKDLFFLDEIDPLKQAVILKERFGLTADAGFTVCMKCNTRLAVVEKSSVLALIPEKVKTNFDSFTSCPACGRVYWKGTHYIAMMEKIKKAGISPPEGGQFKGG
jgi:uncharacterized protein